MNEFILMGFAVGMITGLFESIGIFSFNASLFNMALMSILICWMYSDSKKERKKK